MSQDYDLLFGRFAVELGILSRDSVDAALAALAALDGPPSARRLGAFLVERGALSPDQFRRITAAVSARLGAGASTLEALHARLCLRRKFALAYQVRRASAELLKTRAQGRAPEPLLALLVRQAVLTAEQARIVEEDARDFLLCPACGALLETRGEAPGTEMTCRRCDRLLRVGGPPAPPRAGTGPARPAGHRVGAYRLVREIGKGAMGVVYEARHERTGRPVALKVLPESVSADPDAAERFRREADLVTRSDHPAIVPILDVGEEEGAFYIAMEYVEGDTLDTLIGDAPFPVGLAARTALEVAEGLRYAHERGIIHRDVKPGNILLNAAGQARILDFGLAKQRDVATITASGTVVGTPMYMSPEQASPAAPVDHRTDIYSLGATLYEMLTGIPPFTGENVQVLLRQVRSEEPPPLRSMRAEIPPALENVVRKAMAKDPRFRYPTAADLAADLTRLLENRPVTARPPGLAFRARALVGRYRDRIALLLLAAALLAGGGLLWRMRGETAPRIPGPDAEMASRAFDALRLGHFEEAQSLCDSLARLRPLDPEPLLLRARAFRGLGRPDRALADLDRALSLDPALLPARLDRGTLFLEAGRPDEAAADFRGYLEARPEASEVALQLGRALEQAGELGAARETYRALADRRPDLPEARLAHAALVLRTDPEGALPLLASLAASHPEVPGVHAQLGRARESCELWELAQEAYREEVRRHGGSRALEGALARVARRIEMSRE